MCIRTSDGGVGGEGGLIKTIFLRACDGRGIMAARGTLL